MIFWMIAHRVKSIEPTDGPNMDRRRRGAASAASPESRQKMRFERQSFKGAKQKVLAERSSVEKGGSIPAQSVQVGRGISQANLVVKFIRRWLDEYRRIPAY